MRRAGPRAAFGVALAIAGLALAWSAGPSPALAKSRKKNDQAAASAVQALLAQAKAAMVDGNRKQAVELLDRAAAATRSKAELHEIAGRREIYCEQFVTAEAFQSYQEARGFAAAERWDECVHALDAIGEKDRDNLLVLRQRAACLLSGKQYGPGEAAFRAVLALVPRDIEATLGLAEIAVATKQQAQGLTLLASMAPTASSSDIERAAILKSQLLVQGEQVEDAIKALREDQERHLEHVAVLYELGMLYLKTPGHDWPARKMLSTFVSRCKRMREEELKAHRFDILLPQAQSALASLDQKLGV